MATTDTRNNSREPQASTRLQQFGQQPGAQDHHGGEKNKVATAMARASFMGR